MDGGRRVEVALPTPLRRRFTYLWPAAAPPPGPGQRVLVPFGRRRLTGVVVAVDAPAPAAGVRLRRVQQVIDADPALPAVVMELARFAADYYVVSEGEMLRAALPAGLSASRGSAPAGAPTRRRVVLTGAAPGADLARAPAQAAARGLLQASGGDVSWEELRAAGVRTSTLRALADRGLVRLVDHHREPAPPPALSVHAAPVRLTDEQEAAGERLRRAVAGRESRAFLLHGVTGSGKTEVYLRAAAAALEAGRSALILVPEIGLTPALTARLGERFGAQLAVLHSALPAGERRAHWERARSGAARVVVGARSAVLAPLSDVGLVVVDEEQDTSYKQDESPRYNGRDLALVRARLEGSPCVLASATPSLESWDRARSGRDELLVLSSRVAARPLPRFTIADLRAEYREVGRATLLSRELTAALAETRAAGEQSMLLLNRRGWAAFLLCRACGEPVSCVRCSVSLTWHRRAGRLQCHYCGHERGRPADCPACGESALQEMGAGTERLEDELSRELPGLRVLRMDADAVRRAGGHAPILGRFAAGGADVLVGTQMIAKGHDFHGVTLVGILAGDAALSFPDFRAAEWTFQLASQAAGRAGRGRQAGRVILQAFRADHYALLRARDHDYAGWVADEDAFRRALLYPPHAALAAVRIRHADPGAAADLAREIGERLRADQDAGEFLRVLGPAPAPLARLRGQYRHHILLKSRRRRRLTALLQRLAAWLGARPRQGGHVAVDVDPVSLL